MRVFHVEHHDVLQGVAKMNGHFKGGYVPVPKRHEKELMRLEREKRRFKLALRDKGSNKALKEFCIEGLKRIEAEVTRLKSQ